jgi:hypothetical protein
MALQVCNLLPHSLLQAAILTHRFRGWLGLILSGAWRQGAGTVPASGSKIKKTLLFHRPDAGERRQPT